MNRSAADWRALNPLFLDFEACSTTGWPIEVGWAEVVDGRVVAEGYLIRPEPEWDLGEWDELAEEVHGIGLDRLWAEGVPARVVADRVAAALRGRTVVSDAAAYDGAFLERLMQAGVSDTVFTLTDLAGLVARLSERARRELLGSLEVSTTRHRAMDDAARLALAWQRGLGQG